ncbi:MAG: hypothetical protein PHR77_20540 [Kiritimatiellae bacterium]|nr:hypothetical protein [Kiritimatiellia bacterium]MDD5520075.1 hypothetical protein [Kiritimatiellia bacterium]
MSLEHIIAAVIMILVVPLFYCLPFVMMKRRVEEAKRDPKDLPSVRRALWIRVILGFVLTLFLLSANLSMAMLITIALVPLPMAAWSLGHLIMLKKLEKK